MTSDIPFENITPAFGLARVASFNVKIIIPSGALVKDNGNGIAMPITLLGMVVPKQVIILEGS